MTYQLAVACAGALALLATGGHVIMHAVRGQRFGASYLGTLVLLGLLGGAALTPLIDHLGG